VKNGAVFGKCLEALENIDFDAEVRLVKRVIREAAQLWEESHVIGVQLVLF
jgi:vacuolar-type H+-ATPase subunit E/Vma4